MVLGDSCFSRNQRTEELGIVVSTDKYTISFKRLGLEICLHYLRLFEVSLLHCSVFRGIARSPIDSQAIE